MFYDNDKVCLHGSICNFSHKTIAIQVPEEDRIKIVHWVQNTKGLKFTPKVQRFWATRAEAPVPNQPANQEAGVSGDNG